MRIISEIKVNGKWVKQEQLPKEFVAQVVEETICRAGKVIGFEVQKEKSADEIIKLLIEYGKQIN